MREWGKELTHSFIYFCSFSVIAALAHIIIPFSFLIYFHLFAFISIIGFVFLGEFRAFPAVPSIRWNGKVAIPLSIVCDWWYSLVKGIVRYRLVAKPDNEWSELERWDDKEMACPHSLLSSFSLPPPFNFRSENEGWAKRWGTKRWIDEWEKIPVHSFLASLVIMCAISFPKNHL